MDARRISPVWPDICVSLNVSPVRFSRTESPAIIARSVKHTGLSRWLLGIAIAESGLMEQTTLPFLHGIRALRIAVAIDDFGVGNSSLAYFRRFTANTLKIEISFIRGI